ncbi:hypothetical protein SBDP1_1520006 [Syntrophobacter sp. SbD1]|nr:hypothetical protein SBDP1_1520006 [Syntrophobacter sp. SbD1]
MGHPFANSRDFLKIEIVLDFDAADDALSRGALAQIGRKSLPGAFFLIRLELKVVFHTDRRDLENAFDIFDVSLHIGLVEVFGSADFFPGQRRGQRSHHSAGGRGYDMVESGRVLLFRFDFVKFLYTAVDAIVNRLTEAFDHCSPGGASFSDDPDTRRVDYLSHEIPPFKTG